MRGNYFSTEDYEKTGEFIDLAAHLRVVDTGDGFQVAKGGSVDGKGKLRQYEVMAACKSREEAEELIRKLCAL